MQPKEDHLLISKRDKVYEFKDMGTKRAFTTPIKYFKQFFFGHARFIYVYLKPPREPKPLQK